MKIKKLFFRKEFIDSTIVTFSNFFVGIVNFLFHILMQRLLGPEKYGIVYPLIVLSLFVGLIPSTFQFIFTKDLSIMLKEDKSPFLYIKNSFIFSSITLFVIFIILQSLFPLLKSAFHLDSYIDLYYIILMNFFSFFSVIFLSFLQARENFIFYSLSSVLPVVVKLLCGVVIVYFTKNYLGVMMAFVISNLFGLLVLGGEFILAKNRYDTRKTKEIFTPGEFLKNFFITFPAVSGFIILSNIDSILVRIVLPQQSGVYSSVSVIGKASFYVAISVSTVFLPLLSKSKDLKRSNRLALIFLSIFLAGFTAVAFLISPFISSYILKNQFAGMEKLLPYYTLLYLPYAYITYLVNYYVLARKKIYEISVFIAIVLQSFAIIFFAKNLFDVINIVGLTGFAVLISLIVETKLTRLEVLK
jgi:O-antigen/teichoic acid export membrane protein